MKETFIRFLRNVAVFTLLLVLLAPTLSPPMAGQIGCGPYRSPRYCPSNQGENYGYYTAHLCWDRSCIYNEDACEWACCEGCPFQGRSGRA